jgi:mRNA interferase MazF
VRGDIFRIRSPREARGHEQRGERYAVVLQNDDLALSTILIAPTSTRVLPLSFRVELTIAGQRTFVCLEQITTVDPERRLGEFVGRLSGAEQAACDEAMRAVFGLS